MSNGKNGRAFYEACRQVVLVNEPDWVDAWDRMLVADRADWSEAAETALRALGVSEGVIDPKAVWAAVVHLMNVTEATALSLGGSRAYLNQLMGAVEPEQEKALAEVRRLLGLGDEAGEGS